MYEIVAGQIFPSDSFLFLSFLIFIIAEPFLFKLSFNFFTDMCLRRCDRSGYLDFSGICHIKNATISRWLVNKVSAEYFNHF